MSLTPRFLIGIPTYNNPDTIDGVIRDCLAKTEFPVLVIDDGSDVPVGATWPPEWSARVSLFRIAKNSGKGVALQTGFREAVRRGYTHLIAFDGDGQHLASEIGKVVALARENPWDLVIGCRKLVSENVPGVSKFGRNFSNFWVRFQTSHAISDSQSGFRVYPLFQVQSVRYWTRKFDFEIEVLIRSLWRGVTVREIEVECHYPKPEDRVSHFHKFWDNARISALNTVLVAMSRLRSHHSPLDAGLAAGLGIAIGCTPLFGLHTLIAAAFAFLFRLNAVYLWLGTQISIPPLAPFLAALSLWFGLKITGAPPAGAAAFSLNWFLGSLVTGAVFGLSGGLLTYLAVRAAQKRKAGKGVSWSGRTRGGKFGNAFLKGVLRYAGLKPAYALLYFIVPYFYLFAPAARRAANEYWRMACPELGWARRQTRVLSQLFRFAQTLLDRVYQGFYTEPAFPTRPDGIENILSSVRAGQGLIMVSAHAGSWDIAAVALKSDGMSDPFHSVQYESSGVTFDKARNQTDPEHLKKLVANRADQPVLQIRELLARGLPVGLMGDRPVGTHFELVPMFGKLCAIDCTPFRIAVACRAPLLFTFGFKNQAGNGYDFYASPAKFYAYPPGASAELKAATMRVWAEEYAAYLEAKLRRYPEQWFNFFSFWSTPPRPPELEGAGTRSVPAGSPAASRTPPPTEFGSALGAKPSAEPLSPP